MTTYLTKAPFFYLHGFSMVFFFLPLNSTKKHRELHVFSVNLSALDASVVRRTSLNARVRRRVSGGPFQSYLILMTFPEYTSPWLARLS